MARSEELEVGLDLPLGDMAHVLHPLASLQLQEFAGDRAQRVGDHGVGLQRIVALLANP